jgi:hypothetical protein
MDNQTNLKQDSGSYFRPKASPLSLLYLIFSIECDFKVVFLIVVVQHNLKLPILGLLATLNWKNF